MFFLVFLILNKKKKAATERCNGLFIIQCCTSLYFTIHCSSLFYIFTYYFSLHHLIRLHAADGSFVVHHEPQFL